MGKQSLNNGCPQPGRLRDALGARYQEFTSLVDPVPLLGGPAWDGPTPEQPTGEAGSIYIGSARHETAEYFKDAEKSASIRRAS